MHTTTLVFGITNQVFEEIKKGFYARYIETDKTNTLEFMG
jgi:hypothetical protein